MPAISCSAPGKIILCGEHAVVYQKPAIAIPVFEGSTSCSIVAQPKANHEETLIVAPNIALKCHLKCLVEKHPIKVAIKLVLNKLNLDHLPVCEIRILSTLPTAAGLGSSASTSVALIRALSTFLGHTFTDEEINQLAFEIEKIHHGSPSGIDNTVITYAKTLFFVKDQPYEFLLPGKPITLVIADTGIKSSTSKVVTEVKNHYLDEHEKYESIFARIGELTLKAKNYFIEGENQLLGKTLTNNHILLCEMGVSCDKLDDFVECALAHDALGAKLSGGGQGGNMIALVEPDRAESISTALKLKRSCQYHHHPPARKRISCMTRLIFLKLGGSIITHKDQTNTPDLESIQAIAQGIKQALDQDQSLSLVIGHGSGSFGHHAAKKYGTRKGVFSQEEWCGFAEVALRARQLNQIVTEQLVNCGINAISISPFSGVQTENCRITTWDTSIISDSLYQHLVPVIYGDVILDHRLGGTILSTEELFAYLAPRFLPTKILLAGLEEGVWKDFPQNSQLINEIHPADFSALQSKIRESESPDVTGGMLSKVQSMLSLIKQLPSLEVQIFSGRSSENIFVSLMGNPKGTMIRNPRG